MRLRKDNWEALFRRDGEAWAWIPKQSLLVYIFDDSFSAAKHTPSGGVVGLEASSLAYHIETHVLLGYMLAYGPDHWKRHLMSSCRTKPARWPCRHASADDIFSSLETSRAVIPTRNGVLAWSIWEHGPEIRHALDVLDAQRNKHLLPL